MTVVRKLLLVKAGFHDQVSSLNLPPLESVLLGGNLVLLLGQSLLQVCILVVENAHIDIQRLLLLFYMQSFT